MQKKKNIHVFLISLLREGTDDNRVAEQSEK